MSKSKGQFKLNMDGLLEVLAGSLYANPTVGLRELIQNAHDSCTRYSVEGGDERFRPRISIYFEDDQLVIADNGSGLTLEEVETYLTTIGRSYTRELRVNLSIFEAESSQELIGQFGFGFLSAFLIADRLIVETQSWKDQSLGVRLTAGGGDSFIIEEGDFLEQRGTTIRLNVRADVAFLHELEILSQNIRQFANFLPIPIYLNGSDRPENNMAAPWDAADPDQAMIQYIGREFRMGNPLAIIQLEDHIEVVENGETIKLPLNGFLFIPDSTVVSVQEFGDLHVYIRRMFITDTERDLLPPWAKFVRGLVESPYLHPTASRESVQKDAAYSSIRQALGQQLANALNDIQEQTPRLWRQIVRGHAEVMTGWAVREDSFFAQVANILTFRTSQGEMTLPDYLKLTGGKKIYYVTHDIKSLQEKVLAEGNSHPVIEAVWFAVRPFLQKYARHFGDLELIALDEEPTKLFEPVDEKRFVDLLSAAERLSIPVKMASFAPAEIPALIIHPKDAEKWSNTREALENNDFQPGISDLISSYVDKMSNQTEEVETLFFNARCPLVSQLTDPNLSEQGQHLAIELLYQIARLFSGKAMTATTAIEAFDALNGALGELIK